VQVVSIVGSGGFANAVECVDCSDRAAARVVIKVSVRARNRCESDLEIFEFRFRSRLRLALVSGGEEGGGV
jgi:hypothetical protein